MISVELWERSERSIRYLIIGFHDVGLVGLIATKHLIESLNMEEVGGMDVPTEMPMAPVREGVVKFPLMIYKKDNIAVISPEVPIAPPLTFPIAQAIMDYAIKSGAERVISLTGLANPNRLKVQPELRWIVSDTNIEEMETLKREGKPLMDGVLYGPTAVMLKLAKTRGPPVVALLADAFLEFPDPGAAARVLDGLRAVYRIEVDTKKLLEDAEKIKLRLQEMARQAATVMKESAARPTMYA